MAGTFTFPDDVPTLTDGEVTLRAHRLSDVNDMVVQCTDPESIAWTTLPQPYTRQDAESYAAEIVPKGWDTREELGFAIEAAHDDGVRRFSGSVSLRPHGEGIAELAYGLHPAARGARVCSRAVKLLLDWGFQQPEIDVVTWYAYVGNWASRRVAWANGFSIDGTLAMFLSQRGVRKDSWIGTLRADDSREPKTPWHVPPVLETERLRLRPNRESDAERVGEMIFDERAKHFNGRVKQLENLADGAAVIRRNLESEARGERFNWSVVDRATDELVGHVQLFDLAGTDDSAAKLGYVVHPAWRGRGVVTETLGALVEWAFRPVEAGGLGKRRLSLTTAASNKASRYAAEQVGFVHIATEPEAFTTGESGFDDSVIYHQLNPRWTPWTTVAARPAP